MAYHFRSATTVLLFGGDTMNLKAFSILNVIAFVRARSGSRLERRVFRFAQRL
jgi:hypothetical protein